MEYRVGGGILSSEARVLVGKLLPLFPDLKHRPRIYGYDIELIREDFELYLNTIDNKEFVLEISFFKEKKELLSLMTILRDVFLSLDLIFDIWYCEEDENTLSDEVIFFDNYITSD